MTDAEFARSIDDDLLGETAGIEAVPDLDEDDSGTPFEELGQKPPPDRTLLESESTLKPWQRVAGILYANTGKVLTYRQMAEIDLGGAVDEDDILKRIQVMRGVFSGPYLKDTRAILREQNRAIRRVKVSHDEQGEELRVPVLGYVAFDPESDTGIPEEYTRSWMGENEPLPWESQFRIKATKIIQGLGNLPGFWSGEVAYAALPFKETQDLITKSERDQTRQEAIDALRKVGVIGEEQTDVASLVFDARALVAFFMMAVAPKVLSHGELSQIGMRIIDEELSAQPKAA